VEGKEGEGYRLPAASAREVLAKRGAAAEGKGWFWASDHTGGKKGQKKTVDRAFSSAQAKERGEWYVHRAGPIRRGTAGEKKKRASRSERKQAHREGKVHANLRMEPIREDTTLSVNLQPLIRKKKILQRRGEIRAQKKGWAKSVWDVKL